MSAAEPPAGGRQGWLTAFDRLYDRRVLFLRGELDAARADELCAGLVALDADGDEEVTLIVDSPGGTAHAMLAVHDVIRTMRAPVRTRCAGLAAAEAAVVLAAGTGRREATANARVMLCQPSGEVEGAAADVAVRAEELERLRRRVEELLAAHTGQDPARVRADLDRDLWLSAAEARDYGIVDEVAEARR